jgi:glutamyl-tRNA synthetase
MVGARVMASCGRYAPSPTGALHPGNLRTALLAWLQARLAGGRFIMRMEDLDLPRTRPGSAEQILEDLLWLGLDWDAGPDIPSGGVPYTQSLRDDYYRDALKRLEEAGYLFECYCSRKDIQQAASAPHGPAGTVYPGTCRDGTVKDQGSLPPVWRFRVQPGTMSFVDRLYGRVEQDLERDVGDFVVRRRDGLFAYQLAVVVDDALMGVTDVVRGADLLDSTPRQLALIEALGYPPPRYWHVPLVMDETGRRMAKRDTDNLVTRWREEGRSAEQVIGELAASAGLTDSATAISAHELRASLTLDGFRESLRGYSGSFEL